MKKTLLNLLIAAMPALGTPLAVEAAATPAGESQRAYATQTYSIFMLVKTTPTWLKLNPQQRFAFLRKDIEPILAAHPSVRMRFFDAEGYNSRATDVILWETADLRGYQSVIDALRETRFWGDYFEVVEIVPSVENAYAEAYDEAPVGGR